jgi:hypothetical protein
MNPTPFQIAQGTGRQFAKAFQSQSDRSAIDEILSNAIQSGDSANIDSAMGQILSRVSPEKQPMAMQILQSKKNEILSEQQRIYEQQKALAENQKIQQESEILARIQSGEDVSQKERASLTPTSLRSLIGQQKPVFEPTEEKLEAERVSKLATEIELENQTTKSEEQRLGRMEKLSEEGSLSTPLMVKSMNTIGLPLGVLGNPNTEEYAKLEADFLRDVRNVFPGGRITNYEIQAYLKTVPSLMNSPEGKKAIIRNRKLQNEAKRLRYDAYKDILRENDGRKPRNLSLLIDERISDKMASIEDRFREGIQEEVEKFQQPVRMVAPNGMVVDIPPNQIQRAIDSGAKFQ